MRRRLDPRGPLLLTLLLATSVGAAPAGNEGAGGGILGLGGIGGNRKDPITVTADNLEYDYKSNVVIYKGTVEVVQGDVKLRSDNLTITLAGDAKDPNKEKAADGAAPDESTRVKEIVALGNVRIDQGTRWAVGGRAVFDQDNRTLVLTESPVLHEGKNEVGGDRVVVYLDEDRSVVEGGRKRVKAVFFPGSDGDKAGGGDKPKKKRGETAASAEPR